MATQRRGDWLKRIETAQGPHKDKLLKRFDSNGDGTVSQEDLRAGLETRRENRRNKAFDTVAQGQTTFSVQSEANRRYRPYDNNGDGQVDRQEFLTGLKADLEKRRDARFLGEKLDAATSQRLNFTPAARPTPTPANPPPKEPTAPVTVGNLKDLTWDKAVALVRANGGTPF
jgi:Ca2+-binding EF-hand superfamily protein